MEKFGDLDLSFGTNGKVITNFGGYDYANSVAIAPTSGKIIVAGIAYDANWSPVFAFNRSARFLNDSVI